MILNGFQLLTCLPFFRLIFSHDLVTAILSNNHVSLNLVSPLKATRVNPYSFLTEVEVTTTVSFDFHLLKFSKWSMLNSILRESYFLCFLSIHFIFVDLQLNSFESSDVLEPIFFFRHHLEKKVSLVHFFPKSTQRHFDKLWANLSELHTTSLKCL